MSTRILILTAGFGEGHNAAARNLKFAFDLAEGPDTARVVDLIALASPRINALSRRAYLALINRAPGCWSAFYRWMDRSSFLPRWLWLFSRETSLLADMIAEEKPLAICSTYPVYAYIVESLRRRSGNSRLLHFNIVTDSISINSLWWRPKCQGWFVPNEESAEVVRRCGVEAGLIHAYGFPTPEFIRKNAQMAPPPLTQRPRGRPVPGNAPRVLYLINSGSRGAEETARRLLLECDWDVTFTLGRNHRLRRTLEALAANRVRPAQILGWTNEIPLLLLTHHVVISKAGGATTQEAIAARCPMIVNQVVPGQEEGNYELLRRHGIGTFAETPEAIIEGCRRTFANGGEVWHRWRDALSALSRPDAANAIAEHVLREICLDQIPHGLGYAGQSVPPHSAEIFRPAPARVVR